MKICAHITYTPSGEILALSQNEGVIQISPNGNLRKILIEENSYTYYTICTEQNGRIWIGTDLGLLLCGIDESGKIKSQFIEGLPYSKITSLEINSNQTLFIGTEDAGAYTIDLRAETVRPEPIQIEGFDLSTLSINHLVEDNSKNLWISTNFHGLFQASNYASGKYLRLVDYSEDNLIGTESIQLCFK